MKRSILYTLIIAAFATSCSSADTDNSPPKRPTLTIVEPIAACIEGKPFIIDLQTSSQGELATTILSGSATIDIDGVSAPIDGEWLPLTTSKAQIKVIPTLPGELIVSFQLQASNGLQSNKHIFKTTVQEDPDIEAEVVCEAKFINPNIDSRIPLELSIEKPGYEGDFTVSISTPKGQGKLYDMENSSYSTTFTLPSGKSTIYYHPQILGEHIMEFTIHEGNTTTVARAYLEVVKNIVVICDIPDSYTIAGVGEHSIQNEEVVLKMANNSYNFEISGWYDNNRNLLSKEQQYPLTMSCYCLDTLKVNVKKRVVDITRTGIYNQPIHYPTFDSNGQMNGSKTIYQGRAELTATSAVTDKLVFNYEEYKYDMTVYPPTGKMKQSLVTIAKGARGAGYLYRIDNNFKIYLRKADNPGLTFNITQGYAESSNTRYCFSDRITLQ